jgi:hypothetical protein
VAGEVHEAKIVYTPGLGACRGAACSALKCSASLLRLFWHARPCPLAEWANADFESEGGGRTVS